MIVVIAITTAKGAPPLPMLFQGFCPLLKSAYHTKKKIANASFLYILMPKLHGFQRQKRYSRKEDIIRKMKTADAGPRAGPGACRFEK